MAKISLPGEKLGSSEEWMYSETETMKERYLEAYEEGDEEEMNHLEKQISKSKGKTTEETEKYVNAWITSEEWEEVDGAVDNILAGKSKNNKPVTDSVVKIYNIKVETSDEKSARSSVSSSITSKYKNKYLELLKTNKTKAAKFQNVIISMYMAIGYSKADAMKKIKNWTK